jgi:hypothetical protein
MLEHIAALTSIPYDERNLAAITKLQRIQARLPANILIDDPRFVTLVQEAEEKLDAIGLSALAQMATIITTPPKPRELKIKSSPKGKRITVAAENGVRYSFGPIWNASIVKGKGIALAEINREKLNHHGKMLGVKNVEKLDVKTLAAKIAEKL